MSGQAGDAKRIGAAAARVPGQGRQGDVAPDDVLQAHRVDDAALGGVDPERFAGVGGLLVPLQLEGLGERPRGSPAARSDG